MIMLERRKVMSKKYANDPIVEAVCEFRLAPDAKWDLTIPGLIYEKVRRDFPNKEQRIIQEVELTQSSQGIRQNTRTSERAIFLTNDRKTFIQVGPHLLAISCLKPYPTWEGFKPWIEKAFNALADTVDVKVLQRIGLRYVNRIEIGGKPLKLEDYFEFYPFLGQNLPQDLLNFNMMCVLPFFDRRDSCRVQLTNAVPDESGNIAIQLDLDYFLSQPFAFLANQALEWVDSAHQKVEDIFEGCLAERLRETFREVK